MYKNTCIAPSCGHVLLNLIDFPFKLHLRLLSDAWGAFHQAFCQCFSLTNFISYWNPCIWLAESKFVSEKHWQNAWWNAPLEWEYCTFKKIDENSYTCTNTITMVLSEVTWYWSFIGAFPLHELNKFDKACWEEKKKEIIWALVTLAYSLISRSGTTP